MPCRCLHPSSELIAAAPKATPLRSARINSSEFGRCSLLLATAPFHYLRRDSARRSRTRTTDTARCSSLRHHSVTCTRPHSPVSRYCQLYCSLLLASHSDPFVNPDVTSLPVHAGENAAPHRTDQGVAQLILPPPSHHQVCWWGVFSRYSISTFPPYTFCLQNSSNVVVALVNMLYTHHLTTLPCF